MFSLRAWLSKRSLVSLIQDLIGIKTGLFICEDDIYRLLKGTSYESFIERVKNASDDMILTIRGNYIKIESEIRKY